MMSHWVSNNIIPSQVIFNSLFLVELSSLNFHTIQRLGREYNISLHHARLIPYDFLIFILFLFPFLNINNMKSLLLFYRLRAIMCSTKIMNLINFLLFLYEMEGLFSTTVPRALFGMLLLFLWYQHIIFNSETNEKIYGYDLLLRLIYGWQGRVEQVFKLDWWQNNQIKRTGLMYRDTVWA